MSPFDLKVFPGELFILGINVSGNRQIGTLTHMKNALLSVLLTTAIAIVVLRVSVPMTTNSLLIVCTVIITMMLVFSLVMRDALSTMTRQVQTQERKIEGLRSQVGYLEKKLGEVNTLDDLTGCFNRRHFLELVQHHRGMAQRGQYTFTVCSTELDKFNELAEHYGTSKADEILRLTGSIVKSALREIDSVARMSNAQFGIILAGASEEESVSILTRVNGLINQIKVSDLEPIELSASAGVAEYSDADEDDDLYDRAVKALQFAIAEGRNRVAAHVYEVEQ